MQTPREEFQESLSRCLRTDEFVLRFYERFTSADEEIRERFRFTNMDRQQELLSEALSLCSDAIAGRPEALQHLTELATSHDRWHYNIQPEWYEIWLDSLVAVASETDPYWSDSLEQEWRSILRHVINRMTKAYDG